MYSTHHCLLCLSVEDISDVLNQCLIEMSQSLLKVAWLSLPSGSDIYLVLSWWSITLRKILEEVIMERELLKMKL